MRFREIIREFYFAPSSQGTTLTQAVAALKTAGLNLYRVGGPERVFTLSDTGAQAAAFTTDLGARGVGLVGDQKSNITAVDIWTVFDVASAPDFRIEIEGVDFATAANQIARLISTPTPGTYPVGLQEDAAPKLRSVNAGAFQDLIVHDLGPRAQAMTWSDIEAWAKSKGLKVPQEIRNDHNLKVDPQTWSFAGPQSKAEVDQEFGRQLGVNVKSPMKSASDMATRGVLHLYGRRKDGTFYRIPYLEPILRQLERMLSRETGLGTSVKTMEEQYKDLVDKVTLVASGTGRYIKSLLITGAPSTGKTHTVMKTISKLGLAENRDYTVKKGQISTSALYKLLLERIDDLIIFDDCDSVVKEGEPARNMLKAALDTTPKREISSEKRGLVNTDVMTPEKREEYVNRISRALRGKPTREDLKFFGARMFNKKIGGNKFEPESEIFQRVHYSDDPIDYDDDDVADDDAFMRDIQAIQAYAEARLPNKFDFKGRVIFISNMSEDEWDSAILTRAFTINMNFSSEEMLNFIDGMKQHIDHVISDEEKQEVMDYLRELYITDRLSKPVNFRLVQQCFDLRTTPRWKENIDSL